MRLGNSESGGGVGDVVGLRGRGKYDRGSKGDIVKFGKCTPRCWCHGSQFLESWAGLLPDLCAYQDLEQLFSLCLVALNTGKQAENLQTQVTTLFLLLRESQVARNSGDSPF